MAVISKVDGVTARPTDGGSYLFVTIPELQVSLHDFIRIVREQANVTVTPGTEFGPQFCTASASISLRTTTRRLRRWNVYFK